MEPAAYHAVRSKDLRAGGIRYIATRIVPAHLPIGVSRGIQILQEASRSRHSTPFPEVCRATDAEKQPPLHIAIDTARWNRWPTRRRPTTWMLQRAKFYTHRYPIIRRLERRDGKRNYSLATSSGRPWSESDHNLRSLRRQPTLVDAGIAGVQRKVASRSNVSSYRTVVNEVPVPYVSYLAMLVRPHLIIDRYVYEQY
jgi:hypothetical protein